MRHFLSGSLHFFTLAAAVTSVAAVVLPNPASAHPIDEVEAQAILDLRSPDGRRFEAALTLQHVHLEAYLRATGHEGLPQGPALQALARTASQAFGFEPCTSEPLSQGDVATELADGRWVALRFQVVCPQVPKALTLSRRQYRRDRTRTTVLVALRVGDRPPIETWMPPGMAELTLSLTNGAQTGTRLAPKSATPKDTTTGTSPAEPLPIEDFQPLTQGARHHLPPMAVLRAWAEEGALHLLMGPDHLLFLLTLVLAATGLRGLILGVTGFSLGHVTSMALALALRWPPLPAVEVLIGLSIAASAWQARRPGTVGTRRLLWTSLGFGLLHGLGFGWGLQALTVGVDSLWWPLLSFGLGLDVAQLAWVLLMAGLWALVRRRESGLARWHGRAAWGLVASGVVAGLAAALQMVTEGGPQG